jgi:transposase
MSVNVSVFKLFFILFYFGPIMCLYVLSSSFCPFSFSLHLSVYGFWLHLWYLQTFLKITIPINWIELYINYMVVYRQRELFQQDNARSHTERETMDYLEQNNINVLPWPSKSQDLNPIEHLWDQLDKRVLQRQPPPQTLDQRRQMLQQEWRTIPRNNVRNLIESMPRKCRAVLAARCGHTRF